MVSYKIKWRALGWVGGIAGVVFALDLMLKWYAASAWADKSWFPMNGVSWLEFTYSENPGIAFGLPVSGTFLLILNLLIILGLMAFVLHFLDFRTTSAKLAVGFILGGALGNFYDRLAFGIVRDFLRIGIWPTFNLADAAIVTGVILLCLHFYFPSNGRKKFQR